MKKKSRNYYIYKRIMVYDSIIISTGPAGITATLSTFEYLSKKSNLRQNPLIIDKTA